MKHTLLVRGMQLFFFLLPWQTRWIYDAVMIGGGPSSFGVMSVYATEILFFVLFAYASPLRIAKPLRSLALAAVALAAVCMGSLFWAHDVWVAAAGCVHVMTAMLLFLFLLDERVNLRDALIAFSAGLVIPALLGVYQVFTGGSGASTLLGLAHREAQQLGDAVVTLESGVRIERAYGSFSHPNIFGGHLAVALLAMLWLWKSEKGKRLKKIFGWGMGFFAVILVMTWSRSALLGLCVGLCLGSWSVFHAHIKRFRAFALPLAALGCFASSLVLLSIPSFQERFSIDDTYLAPSITERIVQYAEYPAVVDGAWLFGHGFANYSIAVNAAFFDRLWWQYQPIHNVPLLVLGEIGVFGLIFVLVFLYLLDRRHREHTNQLEAMAAFSFCAALLVIGAFDHYLWSFWSGLSLCALVAACMARLGEKQARKKRN